MKGKMAIIGDGDSVLAFKAGGVDAYGVDHVEKARDLVKKLAKDYAIIFITDTLAKEIDDVVRRYVNMPYPIIIPVPSGRGEQRLRGELYPQRNGTRAGRGYFKQRLGD